MHGFLLVLATALAAQGGTDTPWKERLDESNKAYQQGDYSGAATSARMAMVFANRLDKTDPRRPEILIQCARAKWKLGYYQQSLGHLDDADALLGKLAGKQPRLVARAWNTRAADYCELGRFDEATSLAEKAHKALLGLHDSAGADVIDAVGILAYLKFRDGRESLELREKLHGKGHPETALAYLLTARIRPYQEDTDKLVRRAMRLLQKIDPDHAELAEAWTLLGKHLRIRGDVEGAGQTLEHALKRWRRLDASHPRAAEALAELAAVRGQQGKIAEADKLFAEALERHFSDVDDTQLCNHFARVRFARHVAWPAGSPLNDREAYLAEMLRRRGPAIEKALKSEAKAMTKLRMAMKEIGGEAPRSLEVLTALRRLQGKDDPVAIEIKGASAREAIFPHIPDIAVALVNQDVQGTPVGYRAGGDYRGGRLERWRLDVRDANGKHVPVVPRFSPEGGGLYGPAILKRGQKWHAALAVRNYVELRPGDYTIRVQYHDSDEIAGLDWLGPRMVCQSESIHLHVQPRVIDVTRQEKQRIAGVLEKLDAKGEIKVLAGSYGKGAHKLIPPNSPAGQLLALGWKAVPQLIDESLNEATAPRQRAWMLALLFCITTYHDPTRVEGVLPPYTYATSAWSVHFGTDEAMSAGGAGWSDPHRVDHARIVLAKQLAFTRCWESFRKYIVVRTPD